MRRWAAASLIVVAALHGGATGQWAIALAAAAAILGALAAGARVALSPTGARVLAAVAAVCGGVVGAFFVPAVGQPLRPPWPAFALAGLFAGAALLCQREGERSSATVLLPGLVALTACGEAPLGPVYAVVAVSHLALSLAALRAGDGGRRPLLQTSRRRLAVGAGLFALAAAVAAGFALGLPPLSRWTEARVLHALGGAESGFSDRLWLGSLDGMLQSDEVVMRLQGPRADYLRGAVYDHYEIGRWGRLHPARAALVTTTGRPPAAGERVRVTVVGGARDRYFLPLGASAVATADPGAAADRFGILHVVGGIAREATFQAPPSAAPPDFPVADPGEDDLGLPPDLRAPLERIARAWTEGADSPEARVDEIAARLRTTFTYSLRFDHRRRRDPLLDFLLDDHKGHCEYFASAMTLLARAVGVPARVAVGYRVAEENALGGYWVVRERNAHAWSEVFLPGRGFVTVDATPPGIHRGQRRAPRQPPRIGVGSAGVRVVPRHVEPGDRARRGGAPRGDRARLAGAPAAAARPAGGPGPPRDGGAAAAELDPPAGGARAARRGAAGVAAAGALRRAAHGAGADGGGGAAAAVGGVPLRRGGRRRGAAARAGGVRAAAAAGLAVRACRPACLRTSTWSAAACPRAPPAPTGWRSPCCAPRRWCGAPADRRRPAASPRRR